MAARAAPEAPRRRAARAQGRRGGGHERAPLIQTLASAAVEVGNDPHNQELGLSLLEDYAKTRAHDRDRLLLAQAKHTAGHRKYGDHLECYRRFSEAMAI